MREGEKTIFSVIVGNTVPSQIKAYLDSLHCYVNWTLSVYTKCAESGDGCRNQNLALRDPSNENKLLDKAEGL